MTADLIERLRDAAQENHAEAWRRVDGGQCLTISAMMAEEAADAIEALTTRANAAEAALEEMRDDRDGWYDDATRKSFAIRDMKAALAAAMDALDSIAIYGADTLSGNTRGPDDRDWQRAGVCEMTRRAQQAIATLATRPQTDALAARDAKMRAEGMRIGLAQGFEAGAMQVHANWQPDRAPDFSEAASDYAEFAIAAAQKEAEA